VTDGSSVREIGFGQLAHAGLLRAGDHHGLNVVVVEPDAPDQVEASLGRLI